MIPRAAARESRMPPTIRTAALADVEAMVALSAAKRRAYASAISPFWRPAADAEARQSAWLVHLLGLESACALVAEGASGPRRLATIRSEARTGTEQKTPVEARSDRSLRLLAGGSSQFCGRDAGDIADWPSDHRRVSCRPWLPSTPARIG